MTRTDMPAAWDERSTGPLPPARRWSGPGQPLAADDEQRADGDPALCTPAPHRGDRAPQRPPRYLARDGRRRHRHVTPFSAFVRRLSVGAFLLESLAAGRPGVERDLRH